MPWKKMTVTESKTFLSLCLPVCLSIDRLRRVWFSFFQVNKQRHRNKYIVSSQISVIKIDVVDGIDMIYRYEFYNDTVYLFIE
jgi:hypothetical protein